MSLAGCSPSIRTIRLLRNSAVSLADGEKVAVKALEKIPYCYGPCVATASITFGLDVSPVQSEGILIDYAVNPVIAADGTAGIGC